MTNWRARTKVFYGWWMVAALFGIVFNTGGAGFYVFPVFIPSLLADFGWTVTELSSAAALWALVYGFSGPLVGAAIARVGVTTTMLVGAALWSVALVGYASMQALWMLYANMFVSGIAVAATTLVPAQTVITNWFNTYRGRAMSWMMLGIGAGGLVTPPVAEWLIRAIGWRRTWLLSMLVTVGFVMPLIAVFVRTRPQEFGLRPDGRRHTDAAPPPVTGVSVKRALASRTFWLIVTVYVLQLLGVSAMNFHFVPFAVREAQFTTQQAAFFLGITIGWSMLGRLTFGWLADRWNPARLMASTGLLLAFGPMWLDTVFIRSGVRDVNLLWAYAILYGFGVAGHALMPPVLVGRCFGVLHFSRLMGLVMSAFAIGIVVGIPGAGKIFDTTGSYDIAFLCCATAFVVASLVALAIDPARHQSEFGTE